MMFIFEIYVVKICCYVELLFKVYDVYELNFIVMDLFLVEVYVVFDGVELDVLFCFGDFISLKDYV